MTYDTKVLGVVEYYHYMLNYKGLKWMCGLTDTKYPRFLALGWCLHSIDTIVICKCGRWKLRLLHEQGHSVGLKHTFKIGHVMNPWEFLRGWEGKGEIEELLPIIN